MQNDNIFALSRKTEVFIRQGSLSPVQRRLKKHITTGCSSLTLARKPCFATFAGVGGGGGATPPLAFPNEAS